MVVQYMLVHNVCFVYMGGVLHNSGLRCVSYLGVAENQHLTLTGMPLAVPQNVVVLTSLKIVCAPLTTSPRTGLDPGIEDLEAQHKQICPP